MSTRTRSTYHRAPAAPLAAGSLLVVLALLAGHAASGHAQTATTPALPVGTTLVITGAGDGHGVGMSQWGADGMAVAGFSAAAILAHYYTGTALGTAPPGSAASVLLEVGGTTVRGASTVLAGGKTHHLAHSTIYSVSGSGREIVVSGGERPLRLPTPAAFSGGAALRVGGTAENGVSDGLYRGEVVFARSSSGLDVVNVLPLDEYVQGVVTDEAVASWPVAALEAQAIASRTYALASQTPGAPYELFADTRSQLYRGVSGETPQAIAATIATAGQIVTYAGKPAITYFFASSGGQTEDVQNAFTGASAKPWLVSVADPYDAVAPLHRWTMSLSFAQAASRLAGLVRGSFMGIEVLGRGASPRILSAEILGSGGPTMVTGDELAARLGLYTRWASFSVQGPKGLLPEPDPTGGEGSIVVSPAATATPGATSGPSIGGGAAAPGTPPSGSTTTTAATTTTATTTTPTTSTSSTPPITTVSLGDTGGATAP